MQCLCGSFVLLAEWAAATALYSAWAAGLSSWRFNGAQELRHRQCCCRLQRNILDNKPRVTRFVNTFDEPPAEEGEAAQMKEGLEEGEDGLLVEV